MQKSLMAHQFSLTLAPYDNNNNSTKASFNYAEIKHSDWFKIDTGLGISNKSALFQHSIAKIWFMTSALGMAKL